MTANVQVRSCIWLALVLAMAACKGVASSDDHDDHDGGADSGAMAGSGGPIQLDGPAGFGGVGGVGGAGTSGGSGGSGGSTGGSGGTTPDAGGGQGGDIMDADVPADTGTMEPASCASGTYLLCEDFEDTNVGSIPDGWSKLGDPVAVADDEAASGTRSLKCGPQNDGARRIFRDVSTLPTTHWGRVRFKLLLPVPDAFVHSTIVEFKGDSPIDDAHPDYRVVDTVKEQIEGFGGGGDGNHYQWIYNVQPYSRGETGRGSSYTRRFDDQWHCAEWYIDSVEQEYRFFFDGDELEELHLHNGPGVYNGPASEDGDGDDVTEIPDVFDEISIGWTNYQAAPPGFTAWIDDFAIGSARVPCPP
jgi:hypothetical protein